MKIDRHTSQLLMSAGLLVAFLFLLSEVLGFTEWSPTHELRAGARFELAGVNWSSDRRTLVMAIRPGCPWCTASAALYRDILRSDSSGEFHILTVSPNSIFDTQAYLRSLAVNINAVQQVDFALLGIHATPTLILVNQKGRIESAWVGKLSSERENDVFRALGVKRIPSTIQPSTNQNISTNRP